MAVGAARINLLTSASTNTSLFLTGRTVIDQKGLVSGFASNNIRHYKFFSISQSYDVIIVLLHCTICITPL